MVADSHAKCVGRWKQGLTESSCRGRRKISTLFKIIELTVWSWQMNSPFILAPPLAVKAFYASVSGSYPLPPPYSNFYAFPCLNPPDIDFDFGGTKFPFMRGARGSVADWSGLPGGRFSLGRLKPGSGYCVGAVAETRMGMKEEKEEMVSTGKRSNRLAYKGNLGGNGMRDVWVIGEGFFKGVGGAFDVSLVYGLQNPTATDLAIVQRSSCWVSCLLDFKQTH